MSDWSDMPVVFDRPDWCDKCQGTTVHEVKAYKDEEVRRCTRCQQRTIIRYEGAQQVGFDKSVPDKTKDYYDSKDNMERHNQDYVKFRKNCKRKKGGRK